MMRFMKLLKTVEIEGFTHLNVFVIVILSLKILKKLNKVVEKFQKVHVGWVNKRIRKTTNAWKIKFKFVQINEIPKINLGRFNKQKNMLFFEITKTICISMVL